MPRLMTVWRHPKNRGLYYRQNIPADAQAAAGKKQHLESLKTPDETAARLAYPAAEARYVLLLAGWRGQGARLAQREVLALAGEWTRRVLDDAGADPRKLEHWERLFGLQRPASPPAGASTAVRTLRIPHAEPNPVTLRNEVLSLLESERRAVHVESVDALVHAFGRAVPSLMDTLWRNVGGDYSPDPAHAKFPPYVRPAAASVHSAESDRWLFAKLHAKWKSDGEVRSDTASDYLAKLNNFAKFLGHSDALRVSRDDVRRWRDGLLEGGLRHSTIQGKYLVAVSTVLAYATKDEGGPLDVNPVKGARFKGRGFKSSRRVRPYSSDEVRTLLTAARSLAAPEYRWLPWVFAYTGLRFREAVQCIASDVRAKEGFECLDVNEEHPWKSLKAQDGQASFSLREVPLHPALIAEGFLDYARSLPAGAFLFPAFKPRADGQENTGTPVARWRKWVRSLVADDPSMPGVKSNPAHSFRHAFEDATRRATESDELRKRLAGRDLPATSARYGYGHDIDQKAAVIAKIPRFL